MYEDSAGWYDLDYITQDDLDEDSRSNQDNLQDLDEEWYSRRDTQDFYGLTAVLRMNLDENVHIRSYAHDLVERACTYTGSRRACEHTRTYTVRISTRTRTCIICNT